MAELEKRQTAAEEVMTLLNKLADRSEMIAARVNSALAIVTIPAVECKPLDSAAVRTLPLLFDEYRQKLWAIERSLDDIESTLSRLEL